MITVIAYGVSLLLIYFAVTGFLQMMFSGLLSVLLRPLTGLPPSTCILKLCTSGGAFLAWMALSLLWQWLEGGYMPISILGAGLIWLIIHAKLEFENLTMTSIAMMVQEAKGILMAAAFICWHSKEIRWY